MADGVRFSVRVGRQVSFWSDRCCCVFVPGAEDITSQGKHAKAYGWWAWRLIIGLGSTRLLNHQVFSAQARVPEVFTSFQPYFMAFVPSRSRQHQLSKNNLLSPSGHMTKASDIKHQNCLLQGQTALKPPPPVLSNAVIRELCLTITATFWNRQSSVHNQSTLWLDSYVQVRA